MVTLTRDAKSLVLRGEALGWTVWIPPTASADAAGAKRLALVFGWSLADPVVVAKYSAIYVPLGFVVLQTEGPPPFNLRYPNRSSQRRIEAMLSAVDREMFPEDGGDGGVVVAHVLSNGGTHDFLHFLRAIEDESSSDSSTSSSGLPQDARRRWRRRLKAVAFDSCPADYIYGWRACLRGGPFGPGLRNVLALGGLPQWRILKCILYPFVWFGGSVARWILLPAGVLLSAEAAGHDRLLTALKREDPIAALFLYSDADALTDPRGVEEWGRRLSHVGVRVRMDEYMGPQHLENLRDFPVRYKASVLQLLGDELGIVAKNIEWKPTRQQLTRLRERKKPHHVWEVQLVVALTLGAVIAVVLSMGVARLIHAAP